MKHSNNRLIALIVSIIFVLTMAAQNNPDIVSSINQSGQVVVEAPQALAKRNNSALDKNTQTQQKTEKTNKKSDDDNFADMDDDRDQGKEKDKVKSETPKQPKRERTTQQTIQGRGVGYRIQAYSDNNYRTAKASAQARARAIAMKFPQYRSYISYNAPTWRLRLGDFKTHGDAQAALSRILSVFPNYAREMTIVRDHINVWQ